MCKVPGRDLSRARPTFIARGITQGLQRRDLQARGQPRRRNPEDAHLRVDGPAHHIRQHFGKREAEDGLRQWLVYER